jgi:hypothetical protein
MQDPRRTGISGITGKVVYIRRATGSELVDIAGQLARERGHEPELSSADAVVAAEDGRLIAFAVLDQPAEHDGRGCVTLFENGRRRGIGGLVLRHLLERSAVKVLYAGQDSVRYLPRIGFRRSGSRPVRMRAEGRPCPRRGRARSSPVLYERACIGT